MTIDSPTIPAAMDSDYMNTRLTMESVAILAMTDSNNASVREGETLPNLEASTSQSPNNDSKIDSHEFEWDSLSDPIVDLDMDVVHTYSTQPDVTNEPSVGLEDWTP